MLQSQLSTTSLSGSPILQPSGASAFLLDKKGIKFILTCEVPALYPMLSYYNSLKVVVNALSLHVRALIQTFSVLLTSCPSIVFYNTPLR